MGSKALVASLLLSPLIGFLINGTSPKNKSSRWSGGIATLAVGVSFLASLALIGALRVLPTSSRTIEIHFFNWISVGDLNVPMNFLVDPLSAVMLLVVTGVGTLIHWFSIGYMAHDESPSRYFAYLNLFVFSMLVLVLGGNLPVVFIGWEGVGLCSYLLIGFWFTDQAKAAAGMKAFITNRIGDAAFLIGIFMLFWFFGTVNMNDMLARTSGVVETGWTGPLTLATLMLFIGATGKSAQIPLYVWLPDAMAGPTPVSALIHAATMVTAGIYMIVRLHPLFLASPNTMHVIAVIGALTALMSATVAMTQWDIKKILAYSTVSQLGYMFLAVGVGAFGAAIFHLVTHAFFKGLMFLASGNVIHAMSDEQDIRKMGGLRKIMPLTHAAFFVGWLAIIGIPPFAGFFSKDEILWLAFKSSYGSKGLWLIGLAAAACTAFYMTRLMCLTFWGKSRVDSKSHPHEAPPSMLIPVIILAFLSAIAGFIGVPHVLGKLAGHFPNLLEVWLFPVVGHIISSSPSDQILEWALMGISVSVAGIGGYVAFQLYLRQPNSLAWVTARMGRLHQIVANKYWVDEFYEHTFIQPVVNMSRMLWLAIDMNFIDRVTYLVSDLVKGAAQSIRSFQNGNIQTYASYIVMGIVVFIMFLLVR